MTTTSPAARADVRWIGGPAAELPVAAGRHGSRPAAKGAGPDGVPLRAGVAARPVERVKEGKV